MVGPHGLIAGLDAVSAFKQQLGIHYSEEAEFGWIAEVGLQSPLPPRWTSHTDASTGYVYYVDHDRQASSWENPLVPFLRRIVEVGRMYMQNPTENFFEEQKGIFWHQHKQTLDCWHGPFTDEEGRQYYVNSTEGVSSWQDPRVDAQYIFELESGLLSSLEEVLPEPQPDTPGRHWGREDKQLTAGHWRTADGADVLTLDSMGSTGFGSMGSGGSMSSWRARNAKQTEKLQGLAQQNAKEEHKSTLEKMASTFGRVQGMQQDDEEAQRLHFQKKVAARKRRKEQLAAAKVAGLVSGAAAPALPPPPFPPPDAGAAVADIGIPNLQGLSAAAMATAPADEEALAADGSRPNSKQAGRRSTSKGSKSSRRPSRLQPLDGAPELDAGACGASFAPPPQLPSPLAGKVPVMPADVERMLKRNNSKEAFQGEAFSNMELKSVPEASQVLAYASSSDPAAADAEVARQSTQRLDATLQPLDATLQDVSGAAAALSSTQATLC